jgi:ribosomal protein L7/L12
MGAPADASHRASELLTELGLWDTVLERLGAEGFSQVQSVKATVERLGVPLAEAKRIVHLSPAWEDVRPTNDRLHRSLDEAARTGR